MAQARSGSLGLRLRPRPRLRFDESYIYSRLGAGHAIFNHHILRSKVNYQISRELSLRAILDYNGVLTRWRLL